MDDLAATHLSLDHIPETTTEANTQDAPAEANTRDAPIGLAEEELEAMIE